MPAMQARMKKGGECRRLLGALFFFLYTRQQGGGRDSNVQADQWRLGFRVECKFMLRGQIVTHTPPATTRFSIIQRYAPIVAMSVLSFFFVHAPPKSVLLLFSRQSLPAILANALEYNLSLVHAGASSFPIFFFFQLFIFN